MVLQPLQTTFLTWKTCFATVKLQSIQQKDEIDEHLQPGKSLGTTQKGRPVRFGIFEYFPPALSNFAPLAALSQPRTC